MVKYNFMGRPVISDGDVDYRYTISMYLIRDARPKYWSFHCPRCGEKICELDGDLAYGVDITGGNKGSLRFRCNSRTCGGRQWYEFNLS